MLTEQQIRDMEPGRELDALVAEKVMGMDMMPDCLPQLPRYYLPDYEQTYHRDVPLFSSDISAAWDVLRKMNELEYWVTIAESAKTAGESVFDVTFEKAEIKWAVNDYFCKAVCKCALIAILRGGSGE